MKIIWYYFVCSCGMAKKWQQFTLWSRFLWNWNFLYSFFQQSQIDNGSVTYKNENTVYDNGKIWLNTNPNTLYRQKHSLWNLHLIGKYARNASITLKNTLPEKYEEKFYWISDLPKMQLEKQTVAISHWRHKNKQIRSQVICTGLRDANQATFAALRY